MQKSWIEIVKKKKAQIKIKLIIERWFFFFLKGNIFRAFRQILLLFPESTGIQSVRGLNAMLILKYCLKYYLKILFWKDDRALKFSPQFDKSPNGVKGSRNDWKGPLEIIRSNPFSSRANNNLDQVFLRYENCQYPNSFISHNVNSIAGARLTTGCITNTAPLLQSQGCLANQPLVSIPGQTPEKGREMQQIYDFLMASWVHSLLCSCDNQKT